MTAKVLNALKGGYLEKKEGERTYYVAKEEKNGAVFFVNDQVSVAGPPASVRELLRRQALPQPRGPLQGALNLVSDEHQIVAAVIPPPEFKQFAANIPASYEKARPLMNFDCLAVQARLKSLISPDAFGDTIFLDQRLFYQDEAVAKTALESGKPALGQLQKDLAQEAQKMARESNKAIQQLQIAGLVYIVPVIKWCTQFSNRFEDALNSAEVQREGRTVAIRLRLIADLPQWGVDWARFINDFVNPFAYFHTESQKNLRKLAEAIQTYHTKQTEQRLPPHAVFGADGKPLLSWRVLILPYLDENELFRQFHLNEPWDSPHNKALLIKMPKVFRAPLDSSPVPTKTFYQVFIGKRALFEGPSGLPVDKIPKDGEKTLLIVEGGEAVPWTKPENLDYNPGKPLPKLFGNDPEGFSAVFYNGTTRFIKNTIDEKTLRALILRTESSQVELNKLP